MQELSAAHQLLAMSGDNISGFWTTVLADAETSVENVNAVGGNATLVSLPDIGIEGNSHMMMMDDNNERPCRHH